MLSLADSEIKGEVLYLGYYQSAFDWDDETAKVGGVWDRGRKGPGLFRWGPVEKGRVRVSWRVSLGFVLGESALFFSSLLSFSHPSPMPDVLPRPPSSIAWNATTARPMAMGPSATSTGGPGRPRFGWVLGAGRWHSDRENSESAGRAQGRAVQSRGPLPGSRR